MRCSMYRSDAVTVYALQHPPPLWTRCRERDRPGSPQHVAGVLRDADPDAALPQTTGRSIRGMTTNARFDRRNVRVLPRHLLTKESGVHDRTQSNEAAMRQGALVGSMAPHGALARAQDRTTTCHATCCQRPGNTVDVACRPLSPSQRQSPHLSPSPTRISHVEIGQSHMSRLYESHMSRLDNLTCRDWTRPP